MRLIRSKSLRNFGELLDLIELRSNPKHPYDAGQRNGKLAFRALGFLGGAGLAGLAARAPKLLKLLTGRRKPKVEKLVSKKEADLDPAPSSRYDDVTEARSRFNNRATDVSKSDFESNLIKNGWIKTTKPSGNVFERDGARYVVRDGAKSTGGTTADFYPKGSTRALLKIRLDQGTGQ